MIPLPDIIVLAPGVVIVRGPALLAVDQGMRYSLDAQRRDGNAVRPAVLGYAHQLRNCAADWLDFRAEVTEVSDVADLPESRPSEITSTEAAEMLNCTQRNVRDLCTRGAFDHARRENGRWLLDAAEVRERMAS